MRTSDSDGVASLLNGRLLFGLQITSTSQLSLCPGLTHRIPTHHCRFGLGTDHSSRNVFHQLPDGQDTCLIRHIVFHLAIFARCIVRMNRKPCHLHLYALCNGLSGRKTSLHDPVFLRICLDGHRASRAFPAVGQLTNQSPVLRRTTHYRTIGRSIYLPPFYQ